MLLHALLLSFSALPPFARRHGFGGSEERRTVVGPNSFVFSSRASVDLGGIHACHLLSAGTLTDGNNRGQICFSQPPGELYRFLRGLGSRRGFPFLEYLRFSIWGVLTSELRWYGMGALNPVSLDKRHRPTLLSAHVLSV